ncbi:hypothetical protein HY214_00245 [Candidatus Roizmanbacteria bacterium]|nr:hypothetical protein [Candidatus Roizmanbacteria bacterium]
MDSTQLLLTVVLTVTMILLILVGWQLIFLLRETRRTLTKVNRIIDAFEHVGLSLDHGLGEIYGFMTGLKTLFKVIDVFHLKKHDKSK